MPSSPALTRHAQPQSGEGHPLLNPWFAFNWKHVLWLLLTICVLPQPTIAGVPERFAGLDISQPPSVAEWQYFQRMSDADLAQLWNFFASRGAGTLTVWAWQWRMGWVRRCGTSDLKDFCGQLLRQALQDKAMVIRAESATQIAERVASKNERFPIRLLVEAYQDPRNFRGGKPLFICTRILASLHKIGTKPALKAARMLSSSHSTTKEYWTKLIAHDKTSSQ